MAGNGGLDHDDTLAVDCYSQLVFAEEITGLDRTDHGCFGFSASFSSDDNNNNSPKMLCFGDYAKHENIKVESATKSGQKSGLKCMDSSSPSSTTTFPKSNKKRNGPGTESIWNPGSHAGAPAGNHRTNCKKPKSNNSPTTGHAKVYKKQKLGERITALQQLVSPFGKTDTASVLHEALGYIRFLQDQVQVLCSPYLQHRPPTFAPSNNFDDEEKTDNQSEQIRKVDDLRSRGLCLVPMELTLHVADSNGADLWSSSNAADLLSSAVMI